MAHAIARRSNCEVVVVPCGSVRTSDELSRRITSNKSSPRSSLYEVAIFDNHESTAGDV